MQAGLARVVRRFDPHTLKPTLMMSRQSCLDCARVFLVEPKYVLCCLVHVSLAAGKWISQIRPTQLV